MTCSEIREEFSNRREGILNEARHALFDAHIEACEDCRAEYVSFASVWDALDSFGALPEMELPPDFHRELLSRIEREQIDRAVESELTWRQRMGRIVFGRQSWKVALSTTVAAVLIALAIAFLPGGNGVKMNPGSERILPGTGHVKSATDTGKGTETTQPGDTTGATLQAAVDISVQYSGSVPVVTLINTGPATKTDVHVKVAEIVLPELPNRGPGHNLLTPENQDSDFWVGKVGMGDSADVTVDLAPLVQDALRTESTDTVYALTRSAGAHLTITWTSQGALVTRHLFVPVRRSQAMTIGVSGQVSATHLLATAAGEGQIAILTTSVPGRMVSLSGSNVDIDTAIRSVYPDAQMQRAGDTITIK